MFGFLSLFRCPVARREAVLNALREVPGKNGGRQVPMSQLEQSLDLTTREVREALVDLQENGDLVVLNVEEDPYGQGMLTEVLLLEGGQ